MHWALGNGAHIRVWKDNWLLGGSSAFPKGPGETTLPNLKVQELFISNTKTWNHSLLNSLFQEEDVHRIMRLRPSITGSDDKLYWRYSKTGSYMVKSGYHLQRQIDTEQEESIKAVQHNDQNQVPSSSHKNIRNQLLQKLWKCSIPPKVKIFWWKLLHNGLPVTDTLRGRGCKVPLECQLCGEGSETIIHMLFKCLVTREI